MRITSTICLLSLFFIGCGTESGVTVSQTSQEQPVGVESGAGAEIQPIAAANSDGEYTPVTLEVPTMECPFACYPTVKETLEEQPGVTSVELVPQKEEGVIDDRRVIVNVSEGFSLDEAVAALSKAGFKNASVKN
ncbi:MAG: hypothetical protein R3C19_03000 [Planctomycetaceae bacterium]